MPVLAPHSMKCMRETDGMRIRSSIVTFGLLDQAVDHETMLRRVDVPPALMMALKVQAARRDDAEEALQWREAHTGGAHARQAGAFAALQVFFIF